MSSSAETISSDLVASRSRSAKSNVSMQLCLASFLGALLLSLAAAHLQEAGAKVHPYHKYLIVND